MEQRNPDVIVVGGGVAGLAAALRAGADGFETILVTRGGGGGAVRQMALVEAVPGMPVGLGGSEYVGRALERARAFGVEVRTATEAVRLEPGPELHRVGLAGGEVLAAPAVVIATGADQALPAVPGAPELAGAGVFTALPPAPGAWAGRDVVVTGAPDAVAPAVTALRGCCRSLTVVLQDGEPLPAAPAPADAGRTKLTLLTGTELACACGVGGVEAVMLRSVRSGRMRARTADTLLLAATATPRVAWLGRPLAEVTAHPGIVAAGGVRHDVPLAVPLAVADGLAAARRALARGSGGARPCPESHNQEPADG